MNRSDWPTYHYRGEIVRVIDGDTIHVRVDLGMRVFRETSVRIAGYDAPELFSGSDRAAGQAAKDALEDLLGGVFAEGATVYLKTYKDKTSFDRYVADVWVPSDDGTLIGVAEAMLASGLVHPYP